MHAPAPADAAADLRAAVVTVSDRSAAGMRADGGGPVAVEALREAGFTCDEAAIVPDGADSVEGALRAAIDAGARLIVTTGGTGIGPRDETPEGTARVIERAVPGIADELRRQSVAITPAGLLSRGIAGIAGTALIVNLPGSPKAVAEGMPVILGIAAHALGQLTGEDHP
ncbi:MogA/MoaB family molybdenum cofactor biosynthesis protein [Microbacterium pseudoresistens]|uniref:Molybdenum cofactor synthesis domain-containing protein n=1 Tax=Microbacterium pseudoresistens TaxID=640634 RepID=A0A7Y9ETD8_9MICO|nr:MogA/MoaB family molybdenum cofactor biosynthesis protein [Microbacterium pseudoresistens]NYD53607.1 molybdenum cofactor synthesis domain-containing protein [Microbacterium pseudoresistens]